MKEIKGLFTFTDFSFCVILLMFLGTCPGLKTVQVDVTVIVEFCTWIQENMNAFTSSLGWQQLII